MVVLVPGQFDDFLDRITGGMERLFDVGEKGILPLACPPFAGRFQREQPVPPGCKKRRQAARKMSTCPA